MQAAIGGFAKAHDLPQRLADVMALSAEEIVSNIVRHGFPAEQADRRILCAAAADAERIMLAFEDNGPAYNPLTETPPPDFNPDVMARNVGGLGVHIVKALADEARYDRRANWNRLELGWRR